jgi:hypothetical protein
MLSAVLALAVGASCLGDVDLGNFSSASFLQAAPVCFPILPLQPFFALILRKHSSSSHHRQTGFQGEAAKSSGVFDRGIVSPEPVRLSLASHASSFISSISNDCKKDLDIHTILTNCLVVGGESNCRVDDLNFSRFRASESCASTSEHGPILIARDRGDQGGL